MNEGAEAALARMAARAGVEWPGELRRKLERLTAELLRWNERIRLTGYETSAEIFEHFVLDGFAVLGECPAAGRVLDVGSGAGFPGLVLALGRPTLEVVSVEARTKKAHFQRHAARMLGLANFSVRVERLDLDHPQSGFRDAFDVATAQALAAPEVLLRAFGKCLLPGGKAVLLRGRRWRKERDDAIVAASSSRLALLREVSYYTDESGGERLTVVFKRA